MRQTINLADKQAAQEFFKELYGTKDENKLTVRSTGTSEAGQMGKMEGINICQDYERER